MVTNWSLMKYTVLFLLNKFVAVVGLVDMVSKPIWVISIGHIQSDLGQPLPTCTGHYHLQFAISIINHTLLGITKNRLIMLFHCILYPLMGLSISHIHKHIREGFLKENSCKLVLGEMSITYKCLYCFLNNPKNTDQNPHLQQC